MSAADIGWSGKLPCRGDFVRSPWALAVLDWFDNWADLGMRAVRDGGGPVADAFLTSPLRAFAAAPGASGPRGALGLMAGSMDRSGRLYPFLLAAELDGPRNPGETWAAGAPWFAAAARLMMEALRPDCDPEDLATTSARLAEVLPPAGAEDASVGVAHGPLGGTPVAVEQFPDVVGFFDIDQRPAPEPPVA